MAYESHFPVVHYLDSAPTVTTTRTSTTRVITTESAPVTRVSYPVYSAPHYVSSVVHSPVVVATPRVVTPVWGSTVSYW